MISRVFVRSAVAALLAASSLGTGVRAGAAAASQPRLEIQKESLSDATGACRLDVQGATVAGIPHDVAVRIDGLLAQALLEALPSAGLNQAQWNSACKRAIADSADLSKSMGEAYRSEDDADWTTGLARGRWLSVRLHVSSGSTAQAHPSDNYVAMTFDLAHGGYPVPTGGFYLRAQQKRLNTAIGDAEVALFKTDAPDYSANEARADAMALNLRADQILLKPGGIELTGFAPSEAARNAVLEVPFSALTGVGTPGGPLDAATR